MADDWSEKLRYVLLLWFNIHHTHTHTHTQIHINKDKIKRKHIDDMDDSDEAPKQVPCKWKPLDGAVVCEQVEWMRCVYCDLFYF